MRFQFFLKPNGTAPSGEEAIQSAIFGLDLGCGEAVLILNLNDPSVQIFEVVLIDEWSEFEALHAFS